MHAQKCIIKFNVDGNFSSGPDELGIWYNQEPIEGKVWVENVQYSAYSVTLGSNLSSISAAPILSLPHGVPLAFA